MCHGRQPTSDKTPGNISLRHEGNGLRYEISTLQQSGTDNYIYLRLCLFIEKDNKATNVSAEPSTIRAIERKTADAMDQEATTRRW